MSRNINVNLTDSQKFLIRSVFVESVIVCILKECSVQKVAFTCMYSSNKVLIITVQTYPLLYSVKRFHKKKKNVPSNKVHCVILECKHLLEFFHCFPNFNKNVLPINHKNTKYIFFFKIRSKRKLKKQFSERIFRQIKQTPALRLQ